MIAYSITSRESFLSIDGWMDEIHKYTSDSVKVMLIGNKCDLEDERVVSTEEGAVLFSISA